MQFGNPCFDSFKEPTNHSVKFSFRITIIVVRIRHLRSYGFERIEKLKLTSEHLVVCFRKEFGMKGVDEVCVCVRHSRLKAT